MSLKKNSPRAGVKETVLFPAVQRISSINKSHTGECKQYGCIARRRRRTKKQTKCNAQSGSLQKKNIITYNNGDSTDKRYADEKRTPTTIQINETAYIFTTITADKAHATRYGK